jgi:hypothetical protein
METDNPATRFVIVGEPENCNVRYAYLQKAKVAIFSGIEGDLRFPRPFAVISKGFANAVQAMKRARNFCGNHRSPLQN